MITKIWTKRTNSRYTVGIHITDENGSFVWRGLQYFGSNIASGSWKSRCGSSNSDTSKFCGNPILLETVCHLYPIHVFKLERLYLETTKTLLEDSDLSHLLKIVYLVRDPRAIHASRWVGHFFYPNLYSILKLTE